MFATVRAVRRAAATSSAPCRSGNSGGAERGGAAAGRPGRSAPQPGGERVRARPDRPGGGAVAPAREHRGHAQRVRGQRGKRVSRQCARPRGVTAAWRYRCRRESRESEHPSQFRGPRRSGLCSDSGWPDAQGNRRLAEIFDQYRAHYGEASDASQSASWLSENLSTGRLGVFVAEDSARFVGFAITMDVPASLRLGHFWQVRDLFVLPTHRRLGVGRSLLASVERRRLHQARCDWSCRRRTTTTPLSVFTPTAATP